MHNPNNPNGYGSNSEPQYPQSDENRSEYKSPSAIPATKMPAPEPQGNVFFEQIPLQALPSGDRREKTLVGMRRVTDIMPQSNNGEFQQQAEQTHATLATLAKPKKSGAIAWISGMVVTGTIAVLGTYFVMKKANHESTDSTQPTSSAQMAKAAPATKSPVAVALPPNTTAETEPTASAAASPSAAPSAQADNPAPADSTNIDLDTAPVPSQSAKALPAKPYNPQPKRNPNDQIIRNVPF